MKMRVKLVVISFTSLLLLSCTAQEPEVRIEKRGLDTSGSIELLEREKNNPREMASMIRKINKDPAPGFFWERFWDELAKRELLVSSLGDSEVQKALGEILVNPLSCGNASFAAKARFVVKLTKYSQFSEDLLRFIHPDHRTCFEKMDSDGIENLWKYLSYQSPTGWSWLYRFLDQESEINAQLKWEDLRARVFKDGETQQVQVLRNLVSENSEINLAGLVRFSFRTRAQMNWTVPVLEESFAQARAISWGQFYQGELSLLPWVQLWTRLKQKQWNRKQIEFANETQARISCVPLHFDTWANFLASQKAEHLLLASSRACPQSLSEPVFMSVLDESLTPLRESLASRLYLDEMSFDKTSQINWLLVANSLSFEEWRQQFESLWVQKEFQKLRDLVDVLSRRSAAPVLSSLSLHYLVLSGISAEIGPVFKLNLEVDWLGFWTLVQNRLTHHPEDRMVLNRSIESLILFADKYCRQDSHSAATRFLNQFPDGSLAMIDGFKNCSLSTPIPVVENLRDQLVTQVRSSRSQVQEEKTGKLIALIAREALASQGRSSLDSVVSAVDDDFWSRALNVAVQKKLLSKMELDLFLSVWTRVSIGARTQNALVKSLMDSNVFFDEAVKNFGIDFSLKLITKALLTQAPLSLDQVRKVASHLAGSIWSQLEPEVKVDSFFRRAEYIRYLSEAIPVPIDHKDSAVLLFREVVGKRSLQVVFDLNSQGQDLQESNSYSMYGLWLKYLHLSAQSRRAKALAAPNNRPGNMPDKVPDNVTQKMPSEVPDKKKLLEEWKILTLNPSVNQDSKVLQIESLRVRTRLEDRGLQKREFIDEYCKSLHTIHKSENPGAKSIQTKKKELEEAQDSQSPKQVEKKKTGLNFWEMTVDHFKTENLEAPGCWVLRKQFETNPMQIVDPSEYYDQVKWNWQGLNSESSWDAILRMPALDLSIAGDFSLFWGILDLSADQEWAPVPVPETPEDHDALAIPLTFGLREEKRSELQIFYFNYIFRTPRSPLELAKVIQNAPEYKLKKGISGGNLTLVSALGNRAFDFESQGGRPQQWSKMTLQGGKGVVYDNALIPLRAYSEILITNPWYLDSGLSDLATTKRMDYKEDYLRLDASQIQPHIPVAWSTVEPYSESSLLIPQEAKNQFRRICPDYQNPQALNLCVKGIVEKALPDLKGWLQGRNSLFQMPFEARSQAQFRVAAAPDVKLVNPQTLGSAGFLRGSRSGDSNE